MTDQELKDLVAGLAIQSAKTEAQMAKTDEKFQKLEIFTKETTEQMKKMGIFSKETTEQMKKMGIFSKETTEQMKKMGIFSKETTEQMKKTGIFSKGINERVEGIAKTSGEIAQEFFYSSLLKNKQLAGIDFDFIDNNIYRESRESHHEMDIFLENGNSVGIVEVKSKVREKDLEQLQKIVDNFYAFHPNFTTYKIIPAIAGMSFNKDLQQKALQQGFVVLTQKGDHMEQIYA